MGTTEQSSHPTPPTQPASDETQQQWTAYSQAVVATARAARYGKQLITHMSRKVGGQWNADAQTGDLYNFFGNGTLHAEAYSDHLLLDLRTDPAALEKIEQVVGVHLARFGHKDQLQVVWQRPDGPGSEQGPFSEADMARMATERAARRT